MSPAAPLPIPRKPSFESDDAEIIVRAISLPKIAANPWAARATEDLPLWAGDENNSRLKTASLTMPDINPPPNPSSDDQFPVKYSRLFERLKDRGGVGRLHADRAQRRCDLLDRGALGSHKEAALFLVDPDTRRALRDRPSRAKRIGLRDLKLGRDRNRVIAVTDRRLSDGYIAAHHHGSGLFVDHDSVGLGWPDVNVAKRCDEARCRHPGRKRYLDRVGAAHYRADLSDIAADTAGDLLGQRRVGIVQIKFQRPVIREIVIQLALDGGSAGNLARGLKVGADGRSVRSREISGDRDRPLRYRVNVAVGADQRRHQKRSALQRTGIPHRRHIHVEAIALAHR